MIDPRYNTLQVLFADRVFRIPPYQRFYSWQAKQREDLFSDLIKLANRPDAQHHFMATIVCHKTTEINAIGTAQYRLYDVVDGQQRLTTLILLLKCIEQALAQGSDDRTELARILVKRDGNLILLQTNNANAHIFNRFLRDGTKPTKAETQIYSDRNLAQAIDSCERFLEKWTQTRDTLSLMRLILHRLGFVVYDTEENSVVYTLFEVLNSRGLAVDWLDKTKSVLMGKAYELGGSSVAQLAEIENLQKIWSKIYSELAKEDVPGDEILRIAATLHYGPGQGKPRPADESLELLRKECKLPNSPTQISERLLAVAEKLSTLYANVQLGAVTDILQARLLAVAILSASGVNEDERKKLLDQWERVSFRIFGLYGKDARTKVGDYVRIGYRIVTNDMETRTYNQIMAALHDLGSDYPAAGAVDEGLVGRDFYESADACRYLLWNYEEHLAAKGGIGATVDEHERSAIWKERASDSIEHIFPQNPGLAWNGKMVGVDGMEKPIQHNVGRIGNLLLLPNVLNAQAKANSFEEKKKLYAKHNLRMISEVIANQDWTLVSIGLRESAIASWAKIRWADV
ncbi:MAG TPA: DUF262 domain-containing HNH endonuclease family protein [Candidatus Acidoferrum sp.]|nr:DUF262 domain-containing HNH endonuclease family protein [Candidatus Acidoferrum sp.]